MDKLSAEITRAEIILKRHLGGNISHAVGKLILDAMEEYAAQNATRSVEGVQAVKDEVVKGINEYVVASPLSVFCQGGLNTLNYINSFIDNLSIAGANENQQPGMYTLQHMKDAFNTGVVASQPEVNNPPNYFTALIERIGLSESTPTDVQQVARDAFAAGDLYRSQLTDHYETGGNDPITAPDREQYLKSLKK